MGNRISISFKNKDDHSVVLFNHWGGKVFLNTALNYTRTLKKEAEKQGQMEPLYRLEPQTAMVDFIREITKDETRIKSDLYLGKDKTDGDNSDNGHFTIDLETSDIE